MSRRKLGSRPQHLSAMQGKLDLRQLYSHLNDKTQHIFTENRIWIMWDSENKSMSNQ